MANIDFPASPTNGQSFTAGNVTWIWDGVKWGVPTTAGSGLYLPLSGGVMTGDITLKGDPTLALHPATRRYADSMANDNRVINGDMRIDQRNGGASGTAAGTYTVDRWLYFGAQPGKGTWGRNLNGWARPDFPYCLGFQSSSAYASLAADEFILLQPVEADMVSDFQWGTATAQPVTFSFWAASTLTGTFSGAVKNSTGTRSYPFSYSLPSASTWAKIVVTIPADTVGTWVMSGNNKAFTIGFDLGSGSNFRTTANAWAGGNYDGVTGAVSIVGTNGAQFYLTGVKLEIGSVATPYNRQSLAKSQADCERYFRWVSFNISFYAGVAGGAAGQAVAFAPQMRVAPTLSGAVADPNLTPQVINQASNGWAMITPYGAQPFATATAAGGVTVQGYRSQANAEL